MDRRTGLAVAVVGLLVVSSTVLICIRLGTGLDGTEGLVPLSKAELSSMRLGCPAAPCCDASSGTECYAALTMVDCVTQGEGCTAECLNKQCGAAEPLQCQGADDTCPNDGTVPSTCTLVGGGYCCTVTSHYCKKSLLLKKCVCSAGTDTKTYNIGSRSYCSAGSTPC